MPRIAVARERWRRLPAAREERGEDEKGGKEGGGRKSKDKSVEGDHVQPDYWTQSIPVSSIVDWSIPFVLQDLETRGNLSRSGKADSSYLTDGRFVDVGLRRWPSRHQLHRQVCTAMHPYPS